MNRLSVVFNAQNVESDLPRAIASIKGLADEVVVIDQDSDDKTHEVAKKLGATVYNHKKVQYVELARNFGVAKAIGDWVLILDPDEEISAGLSKKIREIVNKPQADYYRIPRKNIIFGKWIKNTRWWPDYNIRLFKKGAVSWNEIIHTVPLTQGRGMDFEEKEDFPIVHHHYDSIEEYLDRLGRYTSIQADLKVKDGHKFTWRDIITKPSSEFLSRYFSGQGYKDGIHGLILCLLQAFSELVLYIKVWEREGFFDQSVRVSDVVSEMRAKEKELHFWQNDALYKETKNIFYRIKKKISL